VVAEREGFVAVDYVVGVLLVLFAQMLQDTYLLLGLAVEALFVTNNFKGYVRAELVVVAFEDLAKAALAQDFEHFESVQDVVVLNGLVATIIIVVAVVERSPDHAVG